MANRSTPDQPPAGSRLKGEYAVELVRRLAPEDRRSSGHRVAESIGRRTPDREELRSLLHLMIDRAVDNNGRVDKALLRDLAARLGRAEEEVREFMTGEAGRLLNLERLVRLTSDRSAVVLPPTAGLAQGVERPILSSGTGPLRELLDSLPDLAANPYSVLITGATGTGKELIARRLHSLSPFGAGPFVAVDCASLPHGLMESELFGHMKGAFTGAVRSQPGRIERAAGGTLFLDEVAELEPALQVKLLRFLAERVVERLGGGPPTTVNVRIMAATSRDLDDMVARGQFRADLYYRLATLPITVPPLAHRPGDIPVLVEHYLSQAMLETRKVRRFSPRVMELLIAYDFPGNVRELVNFVNHCVAVSRQKMIDLSDLPQPVAHWLTALEGLGLAAGVAPRVARFLAANQGGKVSNADLRRELDCSDTSARNIFNRLTGAGLIRAQGQRGGRRYVVASKGDNQ